MYDERRGVMEGQAIVISRRHAVALGGNKQRESGNTPFALQAVTRVPGHELNGTIALSMDC